MDKVYVLSAYLKLDGVFTDLRTAAEALQFEGFASFIIGLPSGVLHFCGESVAGGKRQNFFLRPLNWFDGAQWV